MTRAPDILTAALGHMQDRAATYDKPEGERSMPATVAAFNALTGHTLTAEQGWLFMTVLKLCRTQQGGHRPDNYEDGAAYFALMGEQAACDRAQVPVDRFAIGEVWRFVGATGHYFTEGHDYAIVAARPGTVWFMDDQEDRHQWSYETLKERFVHQA